jgi:hypothetical protein
MRRSSYLARSAAALVAVFLFAVIGLAIEGDPVAESRERLSDYYKEKGIDPRAEQDRAEEAGPGEEGADPQLGAGAAPAEVSDAEIPATVEATSEGVRALFDATIGGRGRGGHNKNELVDASCRGGVCEIEYHPDGPGVGRVIETQGPLWTGLVKAAEFEEATITATPAKGKGGAKVVITCTRDALDKIGPWGVQSTPAIRRNCDVRP